MKSLTFNSPFLNEAVTIINDKNYQLFSTMFNINAASLDELAFVCSEATGNFTFGEDVYLKAKKLE